MQVTEPGNVDVKLDSTAGVSLWVDGQRPTDRRGHAGRVGRRQASTGLPRRHVGPARPELRVELLRPEKSPATFTVVGGP